MIKNSMAFVLIFLFAGIGISAEKIGVYEYVIKSSDQDFETLSSSLQTALEADFQLLGIVNQKSPNGCDYRTRVFAISSADYTKSLIDANKLTGPFAAVDRINLFEDETGVNISIVNPQNILRTVLMDDEKYITLANDRRQQIRQSIIGAVSSPESTKQYGQFRNKGYIGRTMGVMAGGSFDGKIKDVATVDANLLSTVEKLVSQFTGSGSKWNLTVAYTLIEEGLNSAVIGVASAKVEARSFNIVNAGSDKERKDFKCAGIAHAGAYPMEIVLEQNNDQTVIRIVNSMFRMKMFFEDAGKFAFAKNMTMPGSIQDDLETAIKSVTD